MYYIYAVYNRENNKIYIGQTENLDHRIKFHNLREFKGSYTSRFSGSWVLIYKEKSKSRKEALIREKQLKSYRGREFIKKLIPL
ncbi:MAG TPA: GIY-YIG nuclease family protein [Candidatus Wunengus sp. YC60]|uniref:GIY-YIG nuclease family protein n=1 Tax=Candidatus Wunengus sp. YC60 TaxID=3367697 RepID=UPI0040281FC9